MSGLVGALYDSRAFKPAPSLWELSTAHVPFADLGMNLAPEPRVRGGLVEGDGLTFLTGGSGSGKSSVLAYVAAELSRESTSTEPSRRYLPVFVPVAGRPDVAGDLAAFGKATAKEVLLALRGGLPPEYRDRLERIVASSVTRQQAGPRFNAKIIGRVFGAGADAGVELAGDVVSIVGADDLDNRGGLRTLGDIVRARGHELVLIVEDTDAWASAADGTSLAQRFFSSVVRPLANEVDVGVAIAVQTGWESLAAFMDLRERAVSVSTMPTAGSEEQAATMVRGVLKRRIERGLDDPARAGEDPVAAVFTDGAVEMLAHETFETRGFRTALMRVRDAFDRHGDALPERIDRGHLLDTF